MKKKNNGVFIIAEAGVNHNGSFDLALQLIDVAVEVGADAVKFQTFIAEKVVSKYTRKAEYQCDKTGENESQLDMLRGLELTFDEFQRLKLYCEKKKIEFLSTAFDLESLNYLVSDLGLKTLKIPSGEITNGPFLLAHAKTGCNLILSTGMSTLTEIENALGVIAFGLISDRDALLHPNQKAFKCAFESREGQRKLREKVTLLHCTSEYPAPFEEINLNAIQTMKTTFGLNTGYSDHSQGVGIPPAAVALGASLIEKHFTLDKTLAGPDHQASLSPRELAEMVAIIRAVELALGDFNKKPQKSELKNKEVSRRSLVAACDIEKGDTYTSNNIAIKRPGSGVSPMKYWDILGAEAGQSLRKDELL